MRPFYMIMAIKVFSSSSVGSGRAMVLKGSDIVYCYFQGKMVCANFYSY